MSQNAQSALIIMAKAPAPGFVKTRLAPVLGAEGAAQLAAQMLSHTLQTATQCQAFNHRELCLAPSAAAPLPATMSLSSFVVTEQGDGDLGTRMRRAFERVLSHCGAAIMIGTDAPALSPARLDQAAYDLQTCDAVFVPAVDGGYALIGLRQLIPALFIDMVWSTASVMAVTRQRLKAMGAYWHEYPAVNDIDEPADLVHLPDQWRYGNGILKQGAR